MGQVPGEVIVSAFGVFNPKVVVAGVRHGWTLTDARTICQARTEGAMGQLSRLLGLRPEGLGRAIELLRRATVALKVEGSPLFAGLVACGLPGEPLGEMWRLADQLREYRGDAHTAAWLTAGFDGTEIGLLTELYWGLPLRSYIRTRAWSDEDLDAAAERLVSRGLVADGGLTAKGREEREEVEEATDRLSRAALEALGDDLEELVGLLRARGVAIRAGGGYPASGPHDLASAPRAGGL